MHSFCKVVKYRMYDGTVLTMEDIKKAFHVMTGMKYEYDWFTKSYTNEKEYINFLDGLFGKTIQEYYVEDVDTLIMNGERLRAIAEYRAEQKCSLAEAKEYVDLRTIELRERHAK